MSKKSSTGSILQEGRMELRPTDWLAIIWIGGAAVIYFGSMVVFSIKNLPAAIANLREYLDGT